MSKPDPNRFASQQEAVLIREALSADADDLRGLQQRTERVRVAFSRAESALREAEAVFSCAKAAYEHARALENSLQDEMQRKRGLLHPVRKVPDEIWTIIFSAAVAEARKDQHGYHPSKGAQSAALAISAVSKRWRAVAVAQRELWRFVHIHLGPSWTTKKIQSAQVAIDKRLLALPYPRFELELILEKDVSHDKRFRGLFFAFGRIMTFCRSINVHAADSRADFHDSFLSQHFHRITPYLESLVLEADSCTDELEEEQPLNRSMDPTYYGLFFHHCQRLRAVELGNFSLRRFASSRPSADNIQHVNLWNKQSSLTDRDMADALALYPTVPTCRLYSPYLEHSGDWGPVTAHPHLRSLMLEANQAMDDDFGRALTFPNLQRAAFRNVVGYRCPELSDAVAHFIPRSCPQISRLTLSSIEVTGLLLTVIRALPQLRTLIIDSCPMLGGTLFATPNDPAVFPALRRLFISECNTKGLSGQTLLKFARARCAKHRRDGDTLPLLKRLGVSWNFDDDIETQARAGDFLDDWDDKFADATGGSDDWSDSSGEDELEEEFMAFGDDD